MRQKTKLLLVLFCMVVIALAMFPAVGIAQETVEVEAFKEEPTDVSTQSMNHVVAWLEPASGESRAFTDIDIALIAWQESEATTTLLCLEDDVAIADGETTITLNGSKTLDLNGYAFTGGIKVRPADQVVDGACFTIKDEKGSGCVAGTVDLDDVKAIMWSGTIKNGTYVNGNGQLTMKGGVIASEDGDGVFMYNYGDNASKQAVFTMEGGTITGCKHSGVSIGDHATFNMYGGSITSNGEGVYVGDAIDGAEFNIRGAVRIVDNGSDGKVSNVRITCSPYPYNEGSTYNKINVVGWLEDASGTPAEIGVSLKTWPIQEFDYRSWQSIGVFTTGYLTYYPNEDPAKYFTSDAAASGEAGFFVGRHFVRSPGDSDNITGVEGQIMRHEHSWTYAAQPGTADTIIATCSLGDDEEFIREINAHGACTNSDPSSETLPENLGKATLKIVAPQNKVYDGQPVAATLEADKDWNAGYKLPSYDAKNITYYKDGLDGKALGNNAPKDAGTYYAKYQLEREGDPVVISAGPFTISPRKATVAWSNTMFAYDGSEHKPTATVSNKANGDDVSVSVSGGTASVGTHKATASGLIGGQASNYVLAESSTDYRIVATEISYTAHSQTYGWNAPSGAKGSTAGVTGESKRLEAITVKLDGGTIEYRSHVQGIGWEGAWAKDGGVSGSIGSSKRIEAIQMRLGGDLSDDVSVWYRVHSQTYGWLGWAKDGQPAGTSGQSKRVEAYQAVVLPKGQVPEGFVEGEPSFVGYVGGNAQVQTLGWLGNRSGGMFGTTGKSKRLEAMRLSVSGQAFDGGIEYQTHVQRSGWEGTWSSNGSIAGTVGKSRRVEAVRIRLTPSTELSKNMSVWYRVHSQTYGWLGWAKDGDDAGTAGMSKRVEAVEIQVLPQGQVPRGYDAGKPAFRG